MCILWVSCSNHKSRSKTAQVDVKAVETFRSQLKELKAITDDSTKFVLIQELYVKADPAVRNEVCRDVLTITTKILFYSPEANEEALTFYWWIASDSSLAVKSRNYANTGLSQYYAHMIRNADSATYYVNRVYLKGPVVTDSLNALVYGIYGQINQLRGQLKESAANLYKSAAYTEKTKDSGRLASINGNLANLYRSLGDFNKAVEQRKKALKYYYQVNDGAGIVVFAGGLAADYMDLNQIDSARKYFTQAEDLYKQGIKNPVAEYFLDVTKGGMYISLKRFDSSVYYFDKAKAMLKYLNDEEQDMLFFVASTIAYSHFRSVRGEADKMETYASANATEGNIQRAAEVYFALYNISITQKLGHESIDYYRQYDSLGRLLEDKNNREFVAELESKYETQKKSLKIQVQQRQIERRETLNIVLALSFVLVLVLGSFFFARLQLVRSRKDADQQQQFTKDLLKNTEDERRRIARELHDGVGHELLTLKSKVPGIADAEGKIDAIINDIRMLSRNLHPVVLDQIGFAYSIEHLCEQAMTGGNLFVSAEIDYNDELGRDEELQLYRIVQESLSNVIKYAQARAAKITIAPKENCLHVTIIDNGRGFDVEEKMNSKSAFGLNSITQRCRSLNGKITMNSTPLGTTINLEIPIQHAVHSNS
jgi:two-component system NarL family sensor kinase